MRRRGQRRFLWFTLFNVISFNFVSGNIITLCALRLGADSLLIGVLAAFLHVSELVPPLGKLLVRRFGAVKVMASAWMTRYILMVPLAIALLVLSRGGSPAVALGLCLLCTLGFNIARGVGTASHNPIVGAITSPRDRGTFLSNNQLAIHLMSIATGIGMALLLQRDTGAAGLERYALILAIGIGAGVIASILLYGVPEPLEARKSAGTPMITSFRRGMERPGFRRFLTVHFLTFLILNMSGPFLIVFLKDGYLQGDDAIAVFTVVGSLGAIATALLAGIALDRFGAKPFYFIFMAIIVAAMVLPTISPSIRSPLGFWVFAAALFFLYNLGAVGVGTSINTYFFSLVDPEERLNLGILYFLVTGLSGTAGSLLGGWILTLLQHTHGLGDVAHGLPAFRLYFGVLAGGLVLLFPAILSLEKQGSRDVREVLTSILSLRDLRAIILLGRLARTGDVGDEQRVIQALGESTSGVSSNELLDRLASPIYAIRTEALTALRNQPVDAEIEAALIAEVRNHPFTTAALAAEIIGERGVQGAAESLQAALGSRDYLLQASAMIALSRLGDARGLDAVRALVSRTDNPRLLIAGALALESIRDLRSLDVLLRKLGQRQYPYVRDEILVCVAGMVGMKSVFYGWYRQFLDRSLLGLTAVRDYMQERILRGESPTTPPEVLSLALEESTGRGGGFATAVEESLNHLKILVGDKDAAPLLRRSLADARLARLERYRFLVASILVWCSFPNSAES